MPMLGHQLHANSLNLIKWTIWTIGQINKQTNKQKLKQTDRKTNNKHEKCKKQRESVMNEPNRTGCGVDPFGLLQSI